MTPMIDYALLGRAVAEYQKRGYIYREVPWMVPEESIRATLPEPAPSYVACPRYEYPDGGCDAFVEACYLVGSAEQGFLQMGLQPGAYVGVTPCFRHEEKTDIFHQTGFMKVELFVNREDATVDRVMADAIEVMALLGGVVPESLATPEGYDLEVAEIEVGSYGKRKHTKFGSWVYGTGLALPRFSVARGLALVLQH